MSHEPLEPIMWVALGAVGSALLGVVAMFIATVASWRPRRKGD